MMKTEYRVRVWSNDGVVRQYSVGFGDGSGTLRPLGFEQLRPLAEARKIAEKEVTADEVVWVEIFLVIDDLWVAIDSFSNYNHKNGKN